jgi:hypothetical protein
MAKSRKTGITDGKNNNTNQIGHLTDKAAAESLKLCGSSVAVLHLQQAI